MEQKPIILEMDEAKKELIQYVNEIMKNHNLNCYLMEPAIAELYSQIKITAQNELAQARAQMGAVKSAPNNTK